jgi:hypothetical protein
VIAAKSANLVSFCCLAAAVVRANSRTVPKAGRP